MRNHICVSAAYVHDLMEAWPNCSCSCCSKVDMTCACPVLVHRLYGGLTIEP